MPTPLGFERSSLRCPAARCCAAGCQSSVALRLCLSTRHSPLQQQQPAPELPPSLTHLDLRRVHPKPAPQALLPRHHKPNAEADSTAAVLGPGAAAARAPGASGRGRSGSQAALLFRRPRQPGQQGSLCHSCLHGCCSPSAGN
ncbi:hypothetical protein ABPG75_002747 [Micractinium tetrahymenae]